MVTAKIEMSGRPRHRSRSMKRKQVKTPGRKTVTHYEPKMHSKHLCAICNGILHGKPRGRPVEIQKLSKTERGPVRPFGGMLCSGCTRKIMVIRAKIAGKKMNMNDIPLSLKNYVGAMKE